jgi:hypothetical protein
MSAEPWSLRQTIEAALQRWPVILAWLLAGSLLGWGAALAWPAPARASLTVYVGLNAYRAPSAPQRAEVTYYDFRNLDDYKNWQMEQLTAVIRSQAVLDETLARLQAADPAWGTLTTAGLNAMLDAAWQTAGDWRLSAAGPDAGRAEEAVRAWAAVAVEQVGAAVEQAEAMLLTDLQLQAVAARQAALAARQAILAQSRTALVSELDALQAAGEAPLDPAQAWRLLGLVGGAAGASPAWLDLWQVQPVVGASAGQFQAWMQRALVLIDQDAAAAPGQQAVLAEEYARLAALYQAQSRQSWGLSQNLVVLPLTDEPPEINRSRPTGGLVLGGAGLGLLGWAASLVWQVSRRRGDEPL